MSRKYTPEFKAKIVLEVIQGDRELGEIAAENNLNPNMVRTWKTAFIKNANRVFNERQSEKEIRRKEAEPWLMVMKIWCPLLIERRPNKGKSREKAARPPELRAGKRSRPQT